jgi:hypothetical protein
VWRQHPLEAHPALPKEAVGRFEFGLLRESLRQCSARTGGKAGSNFH